MTRLLLFLLVPLLFQPGYGAIFILIQEMGPDVTATVSGSANLSGLTKASDPSGTAFLRASPVLARFGGGINVDFDTYSGATGPAAIGTGTASFSILNAGNGSGSGPRVGVNGSSIILPDAYTSGTSISASTTWANQSFSSMGLTRGDYTWTWASDSLQISVIPEPASAGALFGGLTLLVLLARRMRSSRR